MAKESRLSISIERLADFAALAWGERWIAPFAETLSLYVGRTVAPSQVHQWISHARPVPAWVAEALGLVMAYRVDELRRQTVATHKLRSKIEQELLSRVLGPAAELAPDVDEDGGPAPRIG
ncbi:hypothetical protein ACYQR9_15620 [Methylobacterium sp. CM6241]